MPASGRPRLVRPPLQLGADVGIGPRCGAGARAVTSRRNGYLSRRGAAQFVEVHIDPDLGLLRVARVVTVVDGGRILNEKLARSQVMGAVVMGIGMTLFEETIFDSSGRIANATLGDYLIPVNADVPELDVVFVGAPDRFNALGVKGIGEVGILGVAAAIGNATYHATGRRLRSLPITLDQLL